jgi:hypothetical protein
MNMVASTPPYLEDHTRGWLTRDITSGKGPEACNEQGQAFLPVSGVALDTGTPSELESAPQKNGQTLTVWLSARTSLVCGDYWPIELATEENTLFELPPINRMVPTTNTRITANITAYSAMSWPLSSDQSFSNIWIFIRTPF